MKIKIPKLWQQALSELPETSMGAQHVDIFLADGRTIYDVAIFNGEDCETDEEFDPINIIRIGLHERLR